MTHPFVRSCDAVHRTAPVGYPTGAPPHLPCAADLGHGHGPGAAAARGRWPLGGPKPVHLAVGVDMDGCKDVLGLRWTAG
ncbi:hypothetical protein [Streptomyces sp. NPDC047453]|uniref:hypothetical protein n=1 Tax=Streptomyces sp. NPDC047453 TaxID=3154812 RepID=UPI0033DEBA09